MAQTRIEKKITVKSVIGGKPSIKKIIEAYEAGGGALRLMEVFGIANDMKEGVSVLPDGKESTWTKLVGTFLARNIETGETVRSGICIMPGAANDLIVGALKGQGAEFRGIEFGFRISAQYDEAAATTYVYKVEALHAPKENDPLEKLAAQLSGTQPALAAPVANLPPLKPLTDSGNGEAPKKTPPPSPAAERPAARK